MIQMGLSHFYKCLQALTKETQSASILNAVKSFLVWIWENRQGSRRLNHKNTDLFQYLQTPIYHISRSFDEASENTKIPC